MKGENVARRLLFQESITLIIHFGGKFAKEGQFAML
jgi:hypothetical protein